MPRSLAARVQQVKLRRSASSGAARLPRAQAGVLALLLAVIGLICVSIQQGPAAASPAADTKNAGIAITLDQLSPVVPEAKSDLVLSGLITNTSSNPISRITVSLRVSTSRITDRDQLGPMAAGTVDPFTRDVQDGTLQLPRELASGASEPWTLQLRVSKLQLGNSGVYFLRIDASSDADGSITGSSRSFFPWFPNPAFVNPVGVVWLWPLSDWPNRDSNGVLLNERTSAELAPGGRLRRLLDSGIGATSQISWAVDPELLQTVEAMSHGYQVIGPSGEPIAGQSQLFAFNWLTQARGSLHDAALYALAYADPDVSALSRANLPEDVVLATTSAPEMVASLLNRPLPPGLGWPPGTRIDRSSLDLLKTAGVGTVILDEGAYPPVTQPQITPNGSALIRTESGPLAAVLADRSLSLSLGQAGSTPADATLARQRFLAETGVIATESQQRRTVVVGPEVRWDPEPGVIADLLETLRTSNWARSASLTRLIAQESSPVTRNLAPMTRAQRSAALSPAYLQRVGNNQRNLELLASILVDPAGMTEPFRAALRRAESGAWRLDRAQGEQLLGRITGQVKAEINKVRVLPSKPVTFPGADGQVPITVANDLSTPVQVGLKLTSDPSVRLVSQPIAPITIPANRKVSTQIPAQVLGTGELSVNVQLTTPAGANYGTSASVTLRTTAYAQAATWVVVIAFASLTFMLLMNSIRRRKQRRTKPAATNAGDPSGGPAGLTPTAPHNRGDPGSRVPDG